MSNIHSEHAPPSSCFNIFPMVHSHPLQIYDTPFMSTTINTNRSIFLFIRSAIKTLNLEMIKDLSAILLNLSIFKLGFRKM